MKESSDDISHMICVINRAASV